MSENNPNPDINKDADVDPKVDPANPDNGTGAQDPSGSGSGGADPKDQNPNDGGEDFKTKFGESTKENQRLMDIMKDNKIDAKTGKVIESVDDGQGGENNDANPKGFTDEELNKAIPGFSNLTDSEKNVIRNAKKTAKDMTDLKKSVAQILDKDKFNSDLSTIKKDKTIGKIISENEDEFKEFAYKPENLKTDTTTLAKAFAFDKGGNQQKETGVKVGLEDGGGSKTLGTTKDGKIQVTSSEAQTLRKTDPRRYNDLVRDKKLVIED